MGSTLKTYVEIYSCLKTKDVILTNTRVRELGLTCKTQNKTSLSEVPVAPALTRNTPDVPPGHSPL